MILYVGGVPIRGTLILSRWHSEAGWPVLYIQNTLIFDDPVLFAIAKY